MAIQVQTIGATDLRLAANITKSVNWANPRVGGALDGLIVGHWRGLIVRMPATATGNVDYAILGSDASNSGNFSGASEEVLRIGGDNVGRGASRMRPFLRTRSSGVDGFAGTGGAEGIASGLPQLGAGVPTFLLWGINHLEHLATPVWAGWFASVPLTGAAAGQVSSYVAPTPIAASWISATNVILFRQMFAALALVNTRTPVGFAAEQLALAQGDFPWDTANNRPHHDAVAALAGFGANTALTYAGLVAAQAGGGLPYPNCVPGRSVLEHHWTLRDLATGLANGGSAGAAPLVPTDQNSLTGGLVDVADLAPAHYYAPPVVDPTISNPPLRFTGGRGTRVTQVSGTRDATQTIQRRWERMSDSTAVSGFDWATIASQSGTAWTTSDLLPAGGPYRLRVRYAANPANTAISEDWLVGTAALLHGQSGMEYALFNGNQPGANNLGLAVAGTAQGLFLKLNNQSGGTAATYAQPALLQVRLRGGETPVVGSGAIAMLNEWSAANPDHPLLIVSMAINGTAMADWAANGVAYAGSTPGHPSWTFMGTIGAVATVASGNASGVVEAYAAAMGRFADAHLLMWLPGISTDAAVRTAYVAGVDARFSNALAAPWLILPPWRVHRDTGDLSGQVITRAAHLDFHAQLGSRGILGPNWLDIVNDSTQSGHSAFNSAPGVPSTVLPVSDGNRVGQSRLGFGLGRALAWAWDRGIKAHGPRVLAAWYSDAGRASIQVELGRQVRTLGGAAIRNEFWISTDNGANFAQTGFSVALSADGTRAVLTSTGAAFPASNVRVDYGRNFPANPAVNADEAATERLLDGLLYDGETYRGGTNFAAAARAGNPLQGSNRVGAGVAGVAVAARGAARLVATERWTGTRNVTVRMMAADGVTVLRERTIAVTGS